ncbi:UPF0764 protein C16orf89 homolog [Anneissia japonica]|uniref:UPF0764 protein C16orf89 homolog n=1 Tax=Anneissia japonica TaxID=1529436 RepID=UPI001425B7CE|nr:UPF0764 protein C16orf89 homolog [Anneissia japonica]
MSSILWIVFIFTVVCPGLPKCNVVENSVSVGLQDLTNALERLLYFLDEQHRDLNVDCIFCLRIVEGQLGSIDKNYAEGKLPHVHNTVISSLNNLQQKTAVINLKALSHTLNKDPVYTIAFLRLIDTPFEIEHHPRQVVRPGLTSKQQGLSDEDTFDEEFSDKCLSDMLGSKLIVPCTLSNECWRFITTADSEGYTATHQVLFFMIAEKTGCLQKLEEKAEQNGQDSINKFYEKICSNIYYLAKRFADNDIFPDEDKDLFMEQIAICAAAGFSQFLNPDWLQLILSWQFENGCFGEVDESSRDEEKIRDSDEYRKMGDGIFGANMIKGRPNFDEQFVKRFNNGNIRRGVKPADITAKYNGRKLLREKILPDTGGCLSHMSGIAAACLVMFFRHFLEDDYYTAQLLSRNANIQVDLEGRVIHFNQGDRIDINQHIPMTIDHVKTDEKLLAVGNVLPLQSIFIILAIILALGLIRCMRRGYVRNCLKRYF